MVHDHRTDTLVPIYKKMGHSRLGRDGANSRGESSKVSFGWVCMSVLSVCMKVPSDVYVSAQLDIAVPRTT